MVNLELDSEERDKAQQKALDRRLELPLWAIAWDAYSLAAAALEQAGSFWAQRCGAGVVCFVVQMTFATSVRHKHIVMELAVNAQAEVPPMKPLLGVLYDELARLNSACLAPLLLEAHSVSFRKDWADKAAKLGAGFDVEKAAAALNPSTLARAVKLHNTLFAVKAVGSASPSGSVQVGGRRPLAVDVGPLGLLIFLAGGVGGQGSQKGRLRGNLRARRRRSSPRMSTRSSASSARCGCKCGRGSRCICMPLQELGHFIKDCPLAAKHNTWSKNSKWSKGSGKKK